MRNHLFVATLYASAYKHRAMKAAAHTKDQIVEHKSELACIAVTTVVVGVVARVAGFQAGYEFATTN